MKEVLQMDWLKLCLGCNKKGYSIEQISDTLDMDIKEVQDIIENATNK